MNELVVLIGLPASGKSTISERYKLSGYNIHSSDELRLHKFGNLDGENAYADVFKELYDNIISDLKNGKDVVLDATNLSSKRRIAFLQFINSKTKCKKVAHVVATPYNDCINRDLKRDKKVGSNVIERMYKSFQMPCKEEGFDSIVMEYSYDDNSIEKYDMIKELEILRKIPQCNPYHTLTIGNHCVEVYTKLYERKSEIAIAGLLHDFGKKFCMSFKDSSGRISDTAHFYNHENCSAYDSMFYLKEYSVEQKVRIAVLINMHMKLSCGIGEKSIEKYKKLYGEEFWEDLALLNKADKGEL